MGTTCILDASAFPVLGKATGQHNEAVIVSNATVDGIHFTDLGFMRYAEPLYPVVKQLIGE